MPILCNAQLLDIPAAKGKRPTPIRSHNPEAVGSNPTPATTQAPGGYGFRAFLVEVAPVSP